MSRYTGFVGDVEGASYVGVGPLRWALTWALSDWGTRSARSAWEVIAHEVNAAQPAYDSGCAVPPAGHSEDHTPPELTPAHARHSRRSPPPATRALVGRRSLPIPELLLGGGLRPPISTHLSSGSPSDARAIAAGTMFNLTATEPPPSAEDRFLSVCLRSLLRISGAGLEGTVSCSPSFLLLPPGPGRGNTLLSCVASLLPPGRYPSPGLCLSYSGLRLGSPPDPSRFAHLGRRESTWGEWA